MSKLIDEVKYDLRFLGSHTLQPKWWKVLKIFVLLGFLAGYVLLFGFAKMVLFLAVFFALCLVIHFTYRAKTRKYTQSWLDFTVGESDRDGKPRRIGKYYYPAVLASAVIAFAISQTAI